MPNDRTFTLEERRAILARARAQLAHGSDPEHRATTPAKAKVISDAAKSLTRKVPDPRIIHGICSSERAVDHSRSSDGSDYCVMLTSGFPLVTSVPLLFKHQGDSIGKVVHISRLGTQIYIRAVIFDSGVWQKIEDYKLRGLSCGFSYGLSCDSKLDEKLGVVKYYDTYTIKEISLVDKPANHDCHCAIFSGGSEARVAGQMSLSEHRRINDQARAIIARSNVKFPPEDP